MSPNPSIERTAQSKHWSASHVERWVQCLSELMQQYERGRKQLASLRCSLGLRYFFLFLEN